MCKHISKYFKIGSWFTILSLSRELGIVKETKESDGFNKLSIEVQSICLLDMLNADITELSD